MPELPAMKHLTEPARQALLYNADGAYAELVVRAPANPTAMQLVRAVAQVGVIAATVQDESEARATLSALWLWHGALDESHRISQRIETATGSFWHAIMHRREGDFSNSKYWYRRCGDHPALARIAPLAEPLARPHAQDRMVARLFNNGWDPFALVDLAERVEERDEPSLRAMVAQLQRLEWRVLFAATVESAIGLAG
jgi:hypothetical protein